MANEEIKLKAEQRAEQGSAAAGRLRRAGALPAAVNRIEGGTTLVKFDAHEFKTMLRHHSSEHVLVSIELDGKTIPALMREVQYDVLTGAPIHVDFGEISLTKKIRVSIPLILHGEPEGVKLGGGVLQQNLRAIDVDCLPTDIVEHFDVDVSALKLSQSLFVRDLVLGETYAIITHKNVPVASVVEAAKEEAATPAEGEAAATPATPEVIAKGKKEEPGAEGAPAAAGAASGAKAAPAKK